MVTKSPRQVAPIIPADAWTFPDESPSFSQFISQAVGNDLTAGDGWDSDVASLLKAVTDDLAALPAFDHLLTAMTFADGELASSDLDALATLFAQWSKTGDALWSDLGGLLSKIT